MEQLETALQGMTRTRRTTQNVIQLRPLSKKHVVAVLQELTQETTTPLEHGALYCGAYAEIGVRVTFWLYRDRYYPCVIEHLTEQTKEEAFFVDTHGTISNIDQALYKTFLIFLPQIAIAHQKLAALAVA